LFQNPFFAGVSRFWGELAQLTFGQASGSTGKNDKTEFFGKISGVLRVARGGYEAKALPLAACPGKIQC